MKNTSLEIQYDEHGMTGRVSLDGYRFTCDRVEELEELIEAWDGSPVP